MPGRSFSLMNQPKIEKERVLLAKRMFYIGCLGLPWLWLVTSFYFRQIVKQKEKEVLEEKLKREREQQGRGRKREMEMDMEVESENKKEKEKEKERMRKSVDNDAERYIGELKKCTYNTTHCLIPVLSLFFWSHSCLLYFLIFFVFLFFSFLCLISTAGQFL